MKKLYKLSIIIFIPLILGLVLNIVGGRTGNEQMQAIGQKVLAIGTPVAMFIIVVVGLILMVTGKLNESKGDNKTQDEQVSGREREEADITDVNSSYSYRSNNQKGEYMIRHVANNYKNSTLKEKVLGWLYFGFLMTDFALIFLFAVLRNLTGVIVCFCIFGGTIIVSIIVKVILEKTSMRAKFDPSKDELLHGKVKACLLSSVSSTGGGERRRTTRITGVTYRVIITLDDTEYAAYSSAFYDEGEEIAFFVRGTRAATIVDNYDGQE